MSYATTMTETDKAAIRRFKAAYVARFASWPDCWNSEKLKDEAVSGEIARQFLGFFDRYGIEDVLETVRHMPWTRLSKPGLIDFEEPCRTRANRRPVSYSASFCGACNGYDVLQVFIGDDGMIVADQSIPWWHVSTKAMPKLYPCPQCQGWKYKGREQLKDAIQRCGIAYAERPPQTQEIPITDDDIPIG